MDPTISNNAYSQEFLDLMRQTTIDVNAFDYSVFYTNSGFNDVGFLTLVKLAGVKFNQKLIFAVPDTEPMNSSLSGYPDIIVVKDFSQLPQDWSNVVFFNFTLLALRPRLFRVKRCVINYIGEDNLSLIQYAAVRDKETLVLPNFLRPRQYNVNDHVLPYRIVLDYFRESSTKSPRLKMLVDLQQQSRTPLQNFLPGMSAFDKIERYTANVYKDSIQHSFRTPSVLIYLFSNRNFNKFLASLQREELWLQMLFGFEKNGIIEAQQLCSSLGERFFMDLQNVPIFPKITDDDYIEWQLWLLYLYRVKRNLMTALPCEYSVVSRSFISTSAPCITLSGTDGLVVNSLCTSADHEVII